MLMETFYCSSFSKPSRIAASFNFDATESTFFVEAIPSEWRFSTKLSLLTNVLFLRKLFNSSSFPPNALAASRFNMAEARIADGRFVKSWWHHEFKNPVKAGPHDSSTLGRAPFCITISMCIFLCWMWSNGFSILSISHNIIPNEYMSAEYPVIHSWRKKWWRK